MVILAFRMRASLVPFIIVFVILSCTEQKPSIKNINAKQFSELIKLVELQVIDVRTKAEVNKGAVEGALNLDITNPDFEKRLSILDAELPTVVYCAVGSRSAVAAKILKEAGFINVYDLTTGYASWRAYREEQYN